MARDRANATASAGRGIGPSGIFTVTSQGPTFTPLGGVVLAILLALSLPSSAADIPALTADGRKVVLHNDGTWEYAPGEAPASSSEDQAPPPSPTYDIEVSVTRCTTGSSYAGIQMSAISRTDAPLAKVDVRYTWRDSRGDPVMGQSWAFDELRPGVQAVEQVLAVMDVQCSDLATIELTGATCYLPRTRERVDCYEGTRIVDGAVPVRD